MLPLANQPKKKWPLWVKLGGGFAVVYTFLGLILYGNIAGSWGEWEEIKTFSDGLFLVLGKVLFFPAFLVSSGFSREIIDLFFSSFLIPFSIGFIFYFLVGAFISLIIARGLQ